MQASDKSLQLLIADDHLLLTDAISIYLSAESNFSVSRAASHDETLRVIASNGIFDIILLDLDMPGMHGMTGVERIIGANSGGHVVLFSGQARQEAVFRALELGARGYIPKTLSAKSLLNAIQFVGSGEIFVPSEFTASVARGTPRRTNSELTDREYSVLRSICQGDANKDIAIRLGISEVSVKMHVRSLCGKLNVTNRTQIAMTAITRGLI